MGRIRRLCKSLKLGRKCLAWLCCGEISHLQRQHIVFHGGEVPFLVKCGGVGCACRLCLLLCLGSFNCNTFCLQHDHRHLVGRYLQGEFAVFGGVIADGNALQHADIIAAVNAQGDFLGLVGVVEHECAAQALSVTSCNVDTLGDIIAFNYIFGASRTDKAADIIAEFIRFEGLLLCEANQHHVALCVDLVAVFLIEEVSALFGKSAGCGEIVFFKCICGAEGETIQKHQSAAVLCKLLQLIQHRLLGIVYHRHDHCIVAVALDLDGLAFHNCILAKRFKEDIVLNALFLQCHGAAKPAGIQHSVGEPSVQPFVRTHPCLHVGQHYQRIAQRLGLCHNGGTHGTVICEGIVVIECGVVEAEAGGITDGTPLASFTEGVGCRLVYYICNAHHHQLVGDTFCIFKAHLPAAAGEGFAHCAVLACKFCNGCKHLSVSGVAVLIKMPVGTYCVHTGDIHSGVGFIASALLQRHVEQNAVCTQVSRELDSVFVTPIRDHFDVCLTVKPCAGVVVVVSYLYIFIAVAVTGEGDELISDGVAVFFFEFLLHNVGVGNGVVVEVNGIRHGGLVAEKTGDLCAEFVSQLFAVGLVVYIKELLYCLFVHCIGETHGALCKGCPAHVGADVLVIDLTEHPHLCGTATVVSPHYTSASAACNLFNSDLIGDIHPLAHFVAIFCHNVKQLALGIPYLHGAVRICSCIEPAEVGAAQLGGILYDLAACNGGGPAVFIVYGKLDAQLIGGVADKGDHIHKEIGKIVVHIQRPNRLGIHLFNAHFFELVHLIYEVFRFYGVRPCPQNSRTLAVSVFSDHIFNISHFIPSGFYRFLLL